MAAIGADPQAWLREQQQKWLDDPNAQRAMIERMQAAAADSSRKVRMAETPETCNCRRRFHPSRLRSAAIRTWAI